MPKKGEMTEWHRTWSTAKGSVRNPQVLKECDFSKGLGPALEKLTKDWDKAADLDELPEKTKTALQQSIAQVHKIILKYHNQIVEGNQKLPEAGGDWLVLDKALDKIAHAIHQDMDAIGIECRGHKDKSPLFPVRLDWKNVDDEHKVRLPDMGGTEIDAEPDRESFEKLAGKLAQGGDYAATAKAFVDSTNTRLFLPQSEKARMKIVQIASEVKRLVDSIKRKLDAQPADVNAAKAQLGEVVRLANNLPMTFHEHGGILKKAVEDFIAKPIGRELIAKGHPEGTT